MKKLLANQKGFTVQELLVGLAILAIVGAIAIPAFKSYLYDAKVKGISADLQAVSSAVENFKSDTGSYPYAPRCLVDPNWASYANVCGDANRWNGKYLRKTIENWTACSLDPTASETDKNGCYNIAYGTVEITNTVGTNGAVALVGLDERTALDVFAVLTGGDVGKYANYTNANIPKTEVEGKSTGAWVVQDTTTGKYTVYIDF